MPVQDAGLSSQGHVLLKPVRNQNAWRPVLGLLSLLESLLPIMGVGSDGLDLGELMDYVAKAFNSPNVEVRSAAVKVRSCTQPWAALAAARPAPARSLSCPPGARLAGLVFGLCSCHACLAFNNVPSGA